MGTRENWIRRHLKTIFVYLLMVTLPALGVLGIIQIGKSLEAPISVGGTWSIEHQQMNGCQEIWNWSENPEIEIKQSGPILEIILNDSSRSHLKGILDRSNLYATSDDQPQLRLHVEFDRGVDHSSLNGSLTIEGCSSNLGLSGDRIQNTSTTMRQH